MSRVSGLAPWRARSGERKRGSGWGCISLVIIVPLTLLWINPFLARLLIASLSIPDDPAPGEMAWRYWLAAAIPAGMSIAAIVAGSAILGTDSRKSGGLVGKVLPIVMFYPLVWAISIAGTQYDSRSSAEASDFLQVSLAEAELLQATALPVLAIVIATFAALGCLVFAEKRYSRRINLRIGIGCAVVMVAIFVAVGTYAGARYV